MAMLTLDKWPGLPGNPLVPINSNYANFNVPVKDSFPLGEICDAIEMPTGLFVLTAFRSIENPGFRKELQRIDDLVVEVVGKKPGSLFYFPFTGLSICGQADPEAAENAIDSPEHDLAVALARVAYKVHKKEQFTAVRQIVGGEVELQPIGDFYTIKEQFATSA